MEFTHVFCPDEMMDCLKSQMPNFLRTMCPALKNAQFDSVARLARSYRMYPLLKIAASPDTPPVVLYYDHEFDIPSQLKKEAVVIVTHESTGSRKLVYFKNDREPHLKGKPYVLSDS